MTENQAVNGSGIPAGFVLREFRRGYGKGEARVEWTAEVAQAESLTAWLGYASTIYPEKTPDEALCSAVNSLAVAGALKGCVSQVKGSKKAPNDTPEKRSAAVARVQEFARAFGLFAVLAGKVAKRRGRKGGLPGGKTRAEGAEIGGGILGAIAAAKASGVAVDLAAMADALHLQGEERERFLAMLAI